MKMVSGKLERKEGNRRRGNREVTGMGGGFRVENGRLGCQVLNFCHVFPGDSLPVTGNILYSVEECYLFISIFTIYKCI